MNLNRLKKSGLITVTFLGIYSQFAMAATGPGGNKVTSADYTATPPAVIEGADPFLMIDLSVELTQQAEAYTDGDVTYGSHTCPDRITGTGFDWNEDGNINGRDDLGICYYDDFDYIGYFDAKKCYVYDTSGANTARDQMPQSPFTDASNNAVSTKPNPHYFRPSSLANADHTCNGANEWSGNYMNWATMSAINEFRYAMTGGARLTDTIGASAETLLIDNKDDPSWRFVIKWLGTGSDSKSKGGQTFDHDPRGLTPFSSNSVIAVNWNKGHRVKFRKADGSTLTYNGQSEFNVIVLACDASVSLEENCVEYTDGTDTWYKPEGLLQNNALKMRYALSSYLAMGGGATNNDQNGGVMRSLAKYIGYLRPAAGGGLEVNPAGEVDGQGRMVFNPESYPLDPGISNSGVVNYINNFALGVNGYKGRDPIAELYYESLRYIKGLPPTPEYAKKNVSQALDPAMYDNFPVFTNWDDPIVNSCQVNYKLYVGDQFAWSDHNLPGSSCISHVDGNPSVPSNPDSDINACDMTDAVGTYEGFYPGTLGNQTRSRGNNNWFIAGLAHYANTNDLRSDFDGDQTVKTFMIDTAEYNSNPPSQQNNPMWLAAKYGGFEDYNGDKDPNNGAGTSSSNDEWDEDGDGVPDTFTVANNPEKLTEGLTAAFVEVSEAASSSSAAAVVANAAGGTGAVYQALYEPRVVSTDNDVVDWTGRVVAFFIDDESRIREDKCESMSASTTNCNKALDDDDPEIRFRIDSVTSETVVDRYPIGGGTPTLGISFDDLQFIWDASSELASLTDSEAKNQRTYTSTADTGRYIFTWIDGAGASTANGAIDSDELLDFVPASFPVLDSNDSTLDTRRYLGFESTNEADGLGNDLSDALVNFIRGEDQNLAGWRNRTIDRDGDGTAEVLRLSDVIHSSPAVVGRPSAGYDFLYNDAQYAFFAARYADRRQMLYVGANDGMLHAFNAGFYNPVEKAFKTQLDGETAHPLGSEVWAYVPQNLLPHLQWLPDLEYPHVYYMDGDVQAFDVNIFDDCSDINTCDHPYGWGTILVATMRFGGGDITIDPNSDSSDGDTTDDVTMRSAVLIFDVTNPEKEPVLLAEITHEEMGYTTSKPALFKKRPRNVNGVFDDSEQRWYLVFGSGPAGNNATSKALALSNAISNQEARAFVIDLTDSQPELYDFDSTADGIQTVVMSSEINSFAGDFSTADWDGDFVDDAVYFGTVGNTVASPTGNLWRWRNILTDPPAVMLNNNNLPITAAPKAVIDRENRPWLYVGTGRFYVSDDILSSLQGEFFGMREPTDSNGDLTYAAVDKNLLADTTDIVVFESGKVTTPSGAQPIDVRRVNNSSLGSTSTAAGVEKLVSNSDGWTVKLGYTLGVQTLTGSRNLLQGELLRNVLLFDEYTPSGDLCEPAGSSRLFNLNFLSGIPTPRVFLESDTDLDINDPNILPAVNLGVGQIIGITVHNDTPIISMSDPESGFRYETPSPTIDPEPFGRRSWREIPLQGLITTP